jgi:hypothetical protein
MEAAHLPITGLVHVPSTNFRLLNRTGQWMRKMHCNLLSAYLQIRRLGSQLLLYNYEISPPLQRQSTMFRRRQVQHASRYTPWEERSSRQSQRRYKMSVRLRKRQPVEASSRALGSGSAWDVGHAVCPGRTTAGHVWDAAPIVPQEQPAAEVCRQVRSASPPFSSV